MMTPPPAAPPAAPPPVSATPPSQIDAPPLDWWDTPSSPFDEPFQSTSRSPEIFVTTRLSPGDAWAFLDNMAP
jgi:hypothetical protein